MSDRDICPAPAIITAGATRRAALGTLLGGALLLGSRDGSEANTEAKRRKQRQKKNLSWQSRMVQVTIDNVNSLVPAYVVYGMYDNSRDWNGCCRQLGTISVPPAAVWTFQAPRAEFGVGNNAWVWIDNTYGFRFHNPEAGSPGVGIALNGMWIMTRTRTAAQRCRGGKRSSISGAWGHAPTACTSSRTRRCSGLIGCRT